MLEELISQLRQKAGNDVKREGSLDDNGLEKVFELTQQSAQEVAKNEMSAGNMGGLMSLFGKDDVPDHSNPIVSKIGGLLIQKLVDQLNLTPDTAKRVEQIVIPVLMHLLNGKVKEGGIGQLISIFTGGKGGGILGGLGKLGGLFK